MFDSSCYQAGNVKLKNSFVSFPNSSRYQQAILTCVAAGACQTMAIKGVSISAVSLFCAGFFTEERISAVFLSTLMTS